jgi:hypothetical protein
MLIAVDRVQPAAPAGAENALRAYRTQLLGTAEIPSRM